MKRIRTINSLVHGLWVETSQIPALHPLPDKRETTHAQDCSLGSSMLCVETGILTSSADPDVAWGHVYTREGHWGAAGPWPGWLKLALPSCSARLWCPHRTLTGATSMVLFTSTMPRTSWWGETASPIPCTFFTEIQGKSELLCSMTFHKLWSPISKVTFWHPNHFILNISFPLFAISCLHTVRLPCDHCFIEEIWQ